MTKRGRERKKERERGREGEVEKTLKATFQNTQEIPSRLKKKQKQQWPGFEAGTQVTVARTTTGWPPCSTDGKRISSSIRSIGSWRWAFGWIMPWFAEPNIVENVNVCFRRSVPIKLAGSCHLQLKILKDHYFYRYFHWNKCLILIIFISKKKLLLKIKCFNCYLILLFYILTHVYELLFAS